MTSKIADLLDELDLFKDFAYPELEAIARYLNFLEIPKGQTIFHEGDPGSNMLILVDGRMSVFKGGESGHHLLSYEGRGRIIGEMALLDNERRSATCVADSNCELLTLGHEGLERLAADYPSLAYRFMFCLARLLSRRLRKTSGILVEYLAA